MGLELCSFGLQEEHLNKYTAKTSSASPNEEKNRILLSLGVKSLSRKERRRYLAYKFTSSEASSLEKASGKPNKFLVVDFATLTTRGEMITGANFSLSVAC